jgi:hypothetical protein
MSSEGSIRALAQTLQAAYGPTGNPVEFAIGKITATGSPCAAVFNAGDTPVACYCVGYTPVVDDVVAALNIGPSYLILGKMDSPGSSGAGTPGQDNFQDLTGSTITTSLGALAFIPTTYFGFGVAATGNVTARSGFPAGLDIVNTGSYFVEMNVSLTAMSSDCVVNFTAYVIDVTNTLVRAIVVDARPIKTTEQLTLSCGLNFNALAGDILTTQIDVTAGTGTAAMNAEVFALT